MAEDNLAGAVIPKEGLAGLMACPACDLLHRRPALAEGDVARCARCGSVIETHKKGAVGGMILASASMAILLVLALWAPFLSLTGGGVTERISLVDAALALGQGWLTPLAFLLIGLVVALPMTRAAAHLWALVPVRLGFPPVPGAVPAFRLALGLRPWAMAEIFLIGVAVSAVKLSGLAQVEPGPALFALGGAVAVLAYEGMNLCRETVWLMIAPDESAA